MFIFAHLSDLHIGPLPPAGFAALCGKRVLGYLSWHARRKAEHRSEVLEALRTDLQARAPAHVAVTGDLTNLALPAEYEQVAGWLQQLGKPADVTVVPGNHDAYVAVPWEASLAHVAGYMQGDALPDTGLRDGLPRAADHFPFVRRRGPVAFVGVSTALPTPPFRATGRVGPGQLERLERALAVLGRAGLFRVILIHHPPQTNAVRSRNRLLDAAAVRDVLARTGAELVLHGHAHRQVQAEVAGPEREVPVLGVASGSAFGRRARRHARYHLCRLSRVSAGWRLDVAVRGFDRVSGRFRGEAELAYDYGVSCAAVG